LHKIETKGNFDPRNPKNGTRSAPGPSPRSEVQVPLPQNLGDDEKETPRNSWKKGKNVRFIATRIGKNGLFHVSELFLAMFDASDFNSELFSYVCQIRLKHPV
jgi:hypothetical protein